MSQKMSQSVHVSIGSLRKLHRIKRQAMGYGSKETKDPERLMWTHQIFFKNFQKIFQHTYIILHDQL